VEATRLLGHDLKYALASAGRVLVSLGRIRPNEPVGEYVADLRHALAEIDRAANTLLGSDPSASAIFSAVDVDDFLSELQPMLRQIVHSSISISVPRPGTGRNVHADVDDLDRIVRALVFGAAETMPDGGDITISTGWLEHVATTRPRDAAWSRRYVRMSVADTGTGRGQETRQRVLASTTPGATSNHAGSVATMVGRLGGYLILESTEDEGSRVHVCLPAAHAGWEELVPDDGKSGKSPGG
jgi:signal transduction histidine kinase